MRFIAFTVLLLLCIGCKHGYPLTNQAPFASYLGHDLTLKRTAVLSKGPWFELGPPDMKDASFTNSLNFRVGVRRGEVRHIATLPVGTVVHLDKIVFAWDGEAGVGSFLAWGKTAMPGTEDKVKFRYIWGVLDTIDRAPWDSDDVPSERYVGRDGKGFKTQ